MVEVVLQDFLGQLDMVLNQVMDLIMGIVELVAVVLDLLARKELLLTLILVDQ